MIQKLVGQSVVKASARPSQASLSASATESAMPLPEPRGDALRRRGRSDHQREHQQHADDLRALRHRERDDRQEQHGQQPQRHALRLGKLGLQAGEQQRPCDGGERRDGDDAEQPAASRPSRHRSPRMLPNSNAVACVA